MRQSARHRSLNNFRKNALKGVLKQVQRLVAQDKHEEAQKLLPDAYQAIDKAAKAGIIKQNNASRKKSGLTRLIAKITK